MKRLILSTGVTKGGSLLYIYAKPRPKKTDCLAVHEPFVTLLSHKQSYYAK